MPPGYYKTVTGILHELGFRYVRNAKGSHEMCRSLESGRIVLVPRPLKSRHTANAILKSAGYTGKVWLPTASARPW